MLPLYEDPCFTFRFADNRIIPRFHLEGVPVGRRISVVAVNPDTGERLGVLAGATVGEGGWVELPARSLYEPGGVRGRSRTASLRGFPQRCRLLVRLRQTAVARARPW
jgi:hypothetical protein